MSSLTLFTAPKPFTDPHIAMIQRNALRSWQQLGPDVSVVLHGDDLGVAEAAAEFDFVHVPDVAANEKGVPYIDDMFRRTRELSDAPVLSIINTDIILFPDFLATARAAHQDLGDFVLVGRRWDLDIIEPLAFDVGWQADLRAVVDKKGFRQDPTASDYFLFSRSVLTQVPNFTIGRAGWDNWMIYHSVQQGLNILDATSEISVVHQNHDYSHLPGGEPHYKLPESKRNVALAGGDRNMYDQLDLKYALIGGQVVRRPLTWFQIVRGVERWVQPDGEPHGLRGRLFWKIRKYRKGLSYD